MGKDISQINTMEETKDASSDVRVINLDSDDSIEHQDLLGTQKHKLLDSKFKIGSDAKPSHNPASDSSSSLSEDYE